MCARYKKRAFNFMGPPEWLRTATMNKYIPVPGGNHHDYLPPEFPRVSSRNTLILCH
jgi:hypothetical protein